MELVPELPDSIRASLSTIEPSVDSEGTTQLFHYPCQVRLRRGETLSRVYIAEAGAYHDLWSVWPWEDSGKQYVDITGIVECEESPCRNSVS